VGTKLDKKEQTTKGSLEKISAEGLKSCIFNTLRFFSQMFLRNLMPVLCVTYVTLDYGIDNFNICMAESTKIHQKPAETQK